MRQWLIRLFHRTATFGFPLSFSGNPPAHKSWAACVTLSACGKVGEGQRGESRRLLKTRKDMFVFKGPFFR
jgi:hypothetical protein